MLYNTVLIYGHLERLQCSTHCFESRLLFSTHVPKLQNSCAALQLQRCHHVEQMFLHPLSFTSTDGNARKSLVSIVVFSFATSTLPVSLINFKSLINFQFDTAIVYLDCALVDTMSGTWPVIGVRFPPRDLLQQYWLLCEEEVHFFAYLLQFSSTASGKKSIITAAIQPCRCSSRLEDLYLENYFLSVVVVVVDVALSIWTAARNDPESPRFRCPGRDLSTL